MQIYFSCSLTGGRADQPIYAAIVASLLAQGHAVPTAALAQPDIMNDEAVVAPEVVYDRDVQWVRASEALIAEVSTPSHGVGYEVALALGQGKPVLCLWREGVRVSKMISGNREAGLTLGSYADEAGALRLVADFVRAAQARQTAGGAVSRPYA